MNSEPTKPFKLCFNNEIHRISKVPADFSALIQNVFIAFKNTIPPSWALKYEDADGDLVMLCNDDDYKAMLECELDSPSKSLKIFLLPLEEGAPGNLAKTNAAFGGIPMAESTFFLGNPSQELKAPEVQVPQQKVVQEEAPVVENESQYERIEGEKLENKEDYYAPVVQEPSQIEPEKPEEPKEEIKEEVVEPKAEEEEENVEEEKQQQEEALPPKAEEEDMDTVPDLEENNETSSAQMDDAVDTHDDGFASEEKADDGVFKKKPAGELASKDQIRFNLRSSTLKESKKEKMRGLVTDILFEHVPVLAELIREYLNDPSAFNLEELRKNMKPREEDKTVHKGIACDACGVKPIIGVRYKCSVCNDFDYCAKCEASVEHPHPFLKIKGTAVNNKVNDASEGHQKRRNSKRLRKLSVEKIAEPSKEEKEEEKIELIEEPKPEQKEEIVEEVKIEEPIVKEEPPVEKPVEKPVPQVEEVKIEQIIEKREESPIGVSLVKEVCTVPGKITVNDKVIYKTVMLKNTGKVEWPSNLVLRNVGGVAGQDVKMVQLTSGKDFSCILILENPGKEDEYTSTWQLSYLDQNKDIQFAGEPFTVGFIVYGDGLSQSQIKKKELEEVKKEEIQEPKKEEPLVVEPPKKVYADRIRETARKVKEVFPDKDIDELCEFVLKNSELSDDELMNKFMEENF